MFEIIQEEIGLSPENQRKILYSIAIILVVWLLRYLLLKLVWRQTEDPRLRYLWKRSIGLVLSLIGIVLINIWFMDICAYFTGKSLGKHKFFPHISPKKTWEGTIGGFIGGGMFAFIFWYFFADTIDVEYLIAVILVCCIFGQICDLLESWFKRKAGIKDSSNILPGHGGILDRFDSLIFSAPFLYLTFVLLNFIDKY